MSCPVQSCVCYLHGGKTAQKKSIASARCSQGNENIFALPIVDRELIKVVRSIPALAMKVGSFHHLERTLTPEFVDYVGKQTVALLNSLRTSS